MKKLSLLLTLCSLGFAHASYYDRDDKENLPTLVNVWPGTPRPHHDLKERSSRKLQPKAQEDLAERISESVNTEDKGSFEALLIRNKPQIIFLHRLLNAMHAKGITQNYDSMLNTFIDIYNESKSDIDIKKVLLQALRKFPKLKDELIRSNPKVQGIICGAEAQTIASIVREGEKTCIKNKFCIHTTQQGRPDSVRVTKRVLFPAPAKPKESQSLLNPLDENKSSQPVIPTQMSVNLNMIEEKKEHVIAANKAKLGIAGFLSLCCSCWWIKKSNEKKIESCKRKERVVDESKEIKIPTLTA